MYKITTLPNQLKIITAYMPNSHGTTSGVFIKTGSRYETAKIAGISHFAEHMFFKGTTNRPTASDISRSVEGIGGYLNAATAQDHTCYYNRVPYKKANTAIEVLSDMMNNSLFLEEEIKKESNVILEELNMYLDTPARYIYDLIMQVVWPNHQLGQDILGRRKSIKNIKRGDILNYLKNNYQPQNMIFSVAGRVNHNQVVQQIKQYFSQRPPRKIIGFKPASSKQTQPQVLIKNKNTDQVHICLGFKALPYNHQDLNTQAVLDVILGTGMSSRLFMNIRERLGLCYSIQTFVEKFEDTGLFGIAAGLNTQKIEAALKAILNELKKISAIPVSQTELSEAKEYLRGAINLQMDNSDNVAMWYGLEGLFAKNISTPDKRIKELLKVKENDIIKLAKKLFAPKNFNLAIIGPFTAKHRQRFLSLLKSYK